MITYLSIDSSHEFIYFVYIYTVYLKKKQFLILKASRPIRPRYHHKCDSHINSMNPDFSFTKPPYIKAVL